MNISLRIFVLAGLVSLLAVSCNPFAKTPQAGVIKTTNGGVDWQTVNKFNQADGKIGDLGPANIGPILYAAKNRKHLYAASYNSGVLKSEDAGESWSKILSNVNIYDVAVDPDDENRIYAAGYVGTNGRVFLTTDGGKSWQDVFTESTRQNVVRAIEYNPASPREVVIGLQAGTIIRSSDGGSNWQLLYTFDDRVQTMQWHKNGTIFVLLQDKGLWSSTDGGRTFSNVSRLLTEDTEESGFTEDLGTFLQFGASEKNPEIIYVSADKGLFKTVDGGGSWRKLGLPAKEEAGIRGIALSPESDNILYAGSGSTMYKSTDGGTSFQTHSIATNGFINYIVVDPDSSQTALAGIVVQ